VKLHERTGRPLGSESFIRQLESLLSRSLFPKKSGPKPKERSWVLCPPNAEYCVPRMPPVLVPFAAAAITTSAFVALCVVRRSELR